MVKPSRLVAAPIIGLALAHIAGAALAVQTSPRQGLLAFAGTFAMLLLGIRLKRVQPHQLLFLAWAMLAWTRGVMGIFPPAATELSKAMERPRENLSVSGTILAEVYQQRYSGQETPVTYVPLSIDGLQRTTQWQSAQGRVLLAINDAPEDLSLAYGDRISVNGVVRIKNAPSVGLYKSRYRMHAEIDDLEKLSSGHGNPMFARCFAARARLANILETNIEDHPDEANILKALLLGYRSELDPELNQQFAQTGTLHIFAISGLHVGILSLLLIAVLKLCGVPKPYWIVPLLPVLVVFVATTGMKASAVRAGIMVALYWGAPFLRRQPNALTAMALAAIIVLTISPQQIADPGFLFSFIIVAGMITLIPALTELFTNWLKPDEWVPYLPDNQPGKLRKGAIWFGGYISVSTSAWLTSMPLTAYFFNLFSPIALIGNLFAVTFAFVIVTLGMLTLILGSIWQPIAGLINPLTRWVITLLLTIIDFLNGLPHAWQHVQAPPLWVVIAYIATLAWFATRRKVDRNSLALLGCALIAWCTYLHLKDQRVHLDVYDVAPGQAAYLKSPGNPGYLIDTGSSFHARNVIRNLHQQGIDRLEGIIITHADIGHVGGLLEIVAALPPERIVLPVKMGKSKKVAEIIDTVRETGIPIETWQRGDEGELCPGIRFRVYHPTPATDFGAADDLSMILHLSHQRTAVLITGGMGLRAEQDLFISGQDPGATVLVTPNHSSWESLSPATVNLIRPRDAIVAGSSFNIISGRINRLRDKDINVFRVQDFGPVRVSFTGEWTRFLEE